MSGMGDGGCMATTRQSFLCASSSSAAGCVAWRDDGLDEELAHGRGRCLVELAIGGDDAAIGRHRVAGERSLIGLRPAWGRLLRRRGWRA